MADSPPPSDLPPPINRQTTTPFLLKLYYQLSPPPISLYDFPQPPYAPSFPHVEIHTWADCTLPELTQMLTSALPASSGLATRERLVFRLVYADAKTGRYKIAEIGGVDLPGARERGEEELKGLRELGFVQGDWIVASVVGGAPGPAGGSGGNANAVPIRGRGGQGRVPTGEWKRGERVEEERGWGGRRGGGGGGWGRGRGGGRFGDDRGGRYNDDRRW